MQSADTPAFDDLDITDPESVENAFKEVVDLIDEAADSAPDEIEDDVKIVSDQFKEFFDQLEDADFDFTEIDQTALDNPEADAATERIDEFCGLDPDAGETVTTDDAAATDDTGDAVLSGEGTVKDELIRQFTAMGMSEDQANCMVENLDMDEVVANGATIRRCSSICSKPATSIWPICKPAADRERRLDRHAASFRRRPLRRGRRARPPGPDGARAVAGTVRR